MSLFGVSLATTLTFDKSDLAMRRNKCPRKSQMPTKAAIALKCSKLIHQPIQPSPQAFTEATRVDSLALLDARELYTGRLKK